MLRKLRRLYDLTIVLERFCCYNLLLDESPCNNVMFCLMSSLADFVFLEYYCGIYCVLLLVIILFTNSKCTLFKL
jgi:hypothetical protein